MKSSHRRPAMQHAWIAGGLLAIAALAPSTSAQHTAPDCQARALALEALFSPLSLQAEDVTLVALLGALEQASGLSMKIAYTGAPGVDFDGLDPESRVSVTSENAAVVDIIEAALEQVAATSFGEPATWQLSPLGVVEIAPRSLLNRKKRLEIYDIADLIAIVPDYPDAPQIDLNQALQSAQGGGGNPFSDTGDGEVDKPTLEENANALMDLITTVIETDQWTRNGGDGGSVRLWKTNLLISAPDYMHRQIAGYRCRE